MKTNVHPGASATGKSRFGKNYQAQIPNLLQTLSPPNSEQVPRKSKFELLDNHIKRAKSEAPEAITGEASKLKVFFDFCKAYELPYKDTNNSIFNQSMGIQITMAERFIFHLQRDRYIQCNFDSARAYLKVALNHYDIETNPLDAMGRNRFRNLKLSFNKNANPGTRKKIALNSNLSRAIVNDWCGSTSSNVYVEATSIKGLLGTATLTYLATALRAGNILRGTSDNKDDLAIHIGDVITFDNGKVFILNNRTKTCKDPVLTHVPALNTTNAEYFCAATRLEALAKWRLRVDGASPDDFLFINPKSNKPLSTGVANNHLKNFIKAIRVEQGIHDNVEKFFSLISLRKTVSTELKRKNCTPEVIACKLKHASITAQMSYICKHRTASKPFIKDLYEVITPGS